MLTPNCTLVELKSTNSVLGNTAGKSPNCTLVELKSKTDWVSKPNWDAPNCTLVELKFGSYACIMEFVSLSKLYLSGIEIVVLRLWTYSGGVSKLYLSGIEISVTDFYFPEEASPNCTLVELKCIDRYL